MSRSRVFVWMCDLHMQMGEQEAPDPVVLMLSPRTPVGGDDRLCAFRAKSAAVAAAALLAPTDKSVLARQNVRSWQWHPQAHAKAIVKKVLKVGAWVHGCMGAWVHGCMSARMHECTFPCAEEVYMLVHVCAWRGWG